MKQNKLVRITFEKPDKDVFLSDYMGYSFILSGHIVPKTAAEYQQFLKRTDDISLENLKSFIRSQINDEKVAKDLDKIKKTWSRIFDLKSTVVQACVWNICLSDVRKIEILKDTDYLYGTMNAKRLDGTRPNWKKRYLNFLPD